MVLMVVSQLWMHPPKTYYDFVATPTSNHRVYYKEENGELFLILGNGLSCELGCTMVWWKDEGWNLIWMEQYNQLPKAQYNKAFNSWWR